MPVVCSVQDISLVCLTLLHEQSSLQDPRTMFVFFLGLLKAYVARHLHYIKRARCLFSPLLFYIPPVRAPDGKWKEEVNRAGPGASRDNLWGFSWGGLWVAQHCRQKIIADQKWFLSIIDKPFNIKKKVSTHYCSAQFSLQDCIFKFFF